MLYWTFTFVLRDQRRESLGYQDHGQDRELTFFTGGLRVASGVQLSASCFLLLCTDLLSGVGVTGPRVEVGQL